MNLPTISRVATFFAALQALIAAALLVSVANSAGAQVPLLDITEHSDDSLTATYDGDPLTVTVLSTDQWFITPPNGFPSVYGAQSWNEPSGDGFNYFEEFGTDASSGGFLVESDISTALNGGPAVPDGAVISNDNGFNNIRFTESVPEPSAFVLGVCGVIGAWFAGRRREK